MGRAAAIIIIAALIAFPTNVASVVPATIRDIQYTTNPTGNSPFAGQVVTTAGVVTAITADGFTIADSIGAWHGIFVYTIASGPTIGDSVQVTGTVQEYYGMTEITDVTDMQFFSSGHPVLPLTVSVGDAGREAFESVLLRVNSVTVTGLLPYGEWVVDDELVCDDLNDYVYFPQIGDLLDTLTGVLFYSFDVFKLEPRNTSDIDGPPIPHYAIGGDVVTMNDTRDVLSDHYVEVVGDRIVAILPTAPFGIPLVETDGLVFPGLIDSHNHAAYNVLDVIPFATTFGDRYEWQSTGLYGEFRDQYNALRDYGGSGAQTNLIHKLAELRALCAGTTTIQGVNCNGHFYDPFAHQGMLANNAERFPSRILSSTFPLTQGAGYWQARAAEYWDRFVIHLAEGINSDSLDEFAAWQALLPVDDRTTIIHGVALGAAEWDLLAMAGGHFVWSPRSNVALYGETADIAGALSAGVNIALAPDWTESGSRHLLDEMKFARALGDSLWGGTLTTQLLAEMVTRNAADALGATGRIGQLRVGFMADIMVVPGSVEAPYDALLDASPKDVALTVASGRPMYGDPGLMAQFGFLTGTEDIVVGGESKRIAVRIVSHAIPEADVAIADVLGALQAAYAASYPPICCFLAIEPDSCARAPVAHADSYNMSSSGTMIIGKPGVLGNDFDGDGEALQAVLVTGPIHGALMLNGDGGFTYEPDGTFTDADAFDYVATDGDLSSSPATVSITASDPTSVRGPVEQSTAGWLRIQPNPFNPTTRITYRLPHAQEVEVAVFDAAGRRVAVLHRGPRTAGPHSLVWDGRDDGGHRIASGVYIVRVRGQRDLLRTKAVLLK